MTATRGSGMHQGIARWRERKRNRGNLTLVCGAGGGHPRCQCVEFGKKIIQNKIRGYMPARIAQFLGNTSRCQWARFPSKRLFLSRHGQSEYVTHALLAVPRASTQARFTPPCSAIRYNKLGRIGGDTGLTDKGELYALALAKFARLEICTDPSTGQTVSQGCTSAKAQGPRARSQEGGAAASCLQIPHSPPLTGCCCSMHCRCRRGCGPRT